MKLLQRFDDWVNTLTNLNVKGKDKRVSAQAYANLIGEHEAEMIYGSDDIAAKVCDLIPEEMVREGFKLVVPDWDENKIRDMQEYLEFEMNWKPIFKQAMSWANLYGGAAIMLGIDDGSPKLDIPLNMENIRKFTYSSVLSRYELIFQTINDQPDQKDCGLPSVYQMQPQYSQGGAPITFIHATRLIRFDGAPLPRRLFIDNGYWSDSVLSRMRTPLMNYGQTQDGIATLMQDFSQAVFKVRDLTRIMSSQDGKSLLQQRLDMVDLCRSVINATMIDSEEEFDRKTTSLTGVAEVMDRMENRLVTASQMPHTVLLGKGPAGGIGEAGRAETRDFYDLVSRRQETVLKPALRQFIKLVFRNKSGPTAGVEPDKWDIKFNGLWQEPEGDIIERRLKQSAIDQTYITSQVLTPDEVARSRFGAGEYSHDTKLDFERTVEQSSPTREEVAAKLPPADRVPEVLQ